MQSIIYHGKIYISCENNKFVLIILGKYYAACRRTENLSPLYRDIY